MHLLGAENREAFVFPYFYMPFTWMFGIIWVNGLSASRATLTHIIFTWMGMSMWGKPLSPNGGFARETFEKINTLALYSMRLLSLFDFRLPLIVDCLMSEVWFEMFFAVLRATVLRHELKVLKDADGTAKTATPCHFDRSYVSSARNF